MASIGAACLLHSESNDRLELVDTKWPSVVTTWPNRARVFYRGRETKKTPCVQREMALRIGKRRYSVRKRRHHLRLPKASQKCHGAYFEQVRNSRKARGSLARAVQLVALCGRNRRVRCIGDLATKLCTGHGRYPCVNCHSQRMRSPPLGYTSLFPPHTSTQFVVVGTSHCRVRPACFVRE